VQRNVRGIHVDHIIGVQKNEALLHHAHLAALTLAEQQREQGGKLRMIGEFNCAPGIASAV